jgi:hypothetical protein
MADSTRDRIIVTIADTDLANIQSIANQLRGLGMNISTILPTTGILAGDVSSSNRPKLLSVPGVLAIEDDGEMHLV